MKKIALAIVALAAFLGLAGSAFAGAEAPCKQCHDVTSAAKKKMGPPLWGVFGRAPSIKDVPFTAWDDAALDKWLTQPNAVKKGTPMSFPGYKDEAKRAEVIAFLKTLK